MTTIESRVEAGARWLDEHEPGWELRIDLGTLNLESCMWCVLGQLFGDFYEALEIKHLADPAFLGFDLEGDDRTGVAEAERWVALTEAWTQLVKRRLDEGIDS